MNPLKRTIGEYLSDNSNRVTIYVGPERVSWTLSEDLLCDQVEYFKNAFKSKFKEGISKKMEFPEDDPKDFSKVVDWLHTQKVTCKFCKISERSSPQQMPSYEPAHELQWCSLWVFADKLGMDRLAEIALQKIEECWYHSKLGISAEAVRFVFENTLESSSLQSIFLKRSLHNFFGDGAVKKFSGLGQSTSVNAYFSDALLSSIRLHISTPGLLCSIPSCVQHRADSGKPSTTQDMFSLYATAGIPRSTIALLNSTLRPNPPAVGAQPINSSPSVPGSLFRTSSQNPRGGRGGVRG